MVLRPTLKLAAKLKLAPLADLPPPTKLCWLDWCGRSFTAVDAAPCNVSIAKSLIKNRLWPLTDGHFSRYCDRAVLDSVNDLACGAKSDEAESPCGSDPTS